MLNMINYDADELEIICKILTSINWFASSLEGKEVAALS